VRPLTAFGSAVDDGHPINPARTFGEDEDLSIVIDEEEMINIRLNLKLEIKNKIELIEITIGKYFLQGIKMANHANDVMKGNLIKIKSTYWK
jgi:hypothetical protein